MAKMVLEFHHWRKTKPDDDNELKVLFLFSLQPEGERQARVKLDHTKTFWTEVRLSRDLSKRGRWAPLPEEQKVKAMFQFAQERIVEAGRKLREAPMFWTPTGSLKDGPPWDLSRTPFPKAPPIVFETRPHSESSTLLARKAAGLTA